MNAYATAAGEPLAFVHLDVEWERGDGLDDGVATSAAVADLGVPVGFIDNGGGAGDDASWARLAAQRMAALEAATAAPPDHVRFQSWFDRPYRVLPEDDPTTFTGLLARYSSPRTTLDVTVDGSIARGSVAAGSSPLAGICACVRPPTTRCSSIRSRSTWSPADPSRSR